MNAKRLWYWSGVAVLAAAISTPATMGQTGSSAPQGEPADQRADLKLTAEQRAQMQEIQKHTQEQMKAVHNDGSLTAEQKRAKVREIQRSQDQQVKGVLTPEQYQRYQRRARDRREDVRDRREDRRDHREDHRDRKNGSRPPRPRRN